MASDAELWDAIKAGDERAFADLFYKYSPRIFLATFKQLKDEEVARHIVNKIFISLWSKRLTLEIKSFEAYLTSAARYHLYKCYNVKSKNKIVLQEDFDENIVQKVENSGSVNLELADLESRIDTGLQILPGRCREIFIMSRRDHLSNDQIADQLGISKRTVENQITYALKHLRVLLRSAWFFILLFKFLG